MLHLGLRRRIHVFIERRPLSNISFIAHKSSLIEGTKNRDLFTFPIEYRLGLILICLRSLLLLSL